MSTSIYDFKVTTWNGEILDLASLQRKVILIVNTASGCSLTPQYTELVQLYTKYRDQGLVILGFPCNQFGHQEPGSNAQIRDFCDLNYQVNFPLMAKIKVNGTNTEPVYKYLKSKASGILGSSSIKWNFTKFLINRNATKIVRYPPQLKPLKLEIGIKSLLEE